MLKGSRNLSCPVFTFWTALESSRCRNREGSNLVSNGRRLFGSAQRLRGVVQIAVLQPTTGRLYEHWMDYAQR